MPLMRRTGLLLPSLLCLTTILGTGTMGCGSGGTPIVSQPAFSPAPGDYSAPQRVTLTDDSPDATIYYTTNGTPPTTASTRYTAPILISATTTLEVTAAIPGYRDSPAIAATYVIAAPQSAATPTFTPPAGTYSTPQSVAIKDTTPNAHLFYTTDGTTPTTSSAPYTAPFTISSAATVQAIATAPNFAQSSVATATYTIGTQPSGKGMWTWMGGSTLSGLPAVYRTLGVADPANTPGGNSGGLIFPGPGGTVFLFGGSNGGNTIDRNALWQYNPATAQWTWLAGSSDVNSKGDYGTLGVPSPSNQPASRDSAAGWTDRSGKLYFFGGSTDDSGLPEELNDLWTYDSPTATFTWIGGSDFAGSYGSSGTIGVPASFNIPGARLDTSACSDQQGHFWMFGGAGAYPPFGNLGYLNDLWQYDPATSLWTWYTGSNQANQAGVYGVQGTPGAANTPGGRFGMTCWTALDGKLWFFGSYGLSSSASQQGFLENNDLWNFDPITHLWTWIGGSPAPNQFGVYGNLGQQASGNIPGARSYGGNWIDKNGDLWLFGGVVINPSSGTPLIANDLWRYNIASGQWTWMSGDPSSPLVPYSVYGTLGVPAPGNTPGARDAPATWVDSEGNLWLFGGFGYDSAGGAGLLNDLWRYQP